MNETDIKQVLFDCKSQQPDAEVDPKGLYCDNLDVIEFGRKIALKERAECIKFVNSLNYLVAQALDEKRKHL
jgi:nitric oxide synthase oxygenase domain/subunit